MARGERVKRARSFLFSALLMGSSLPVVAQPLLAGGTDWKPFSFEDAYGLPRGISVEVTQQALALSGLQAQFLFYPTNRLNVLLAREQLDLNYADSPQWNETADAQQFVYSVPYFELHEHLYFLAEHPARNLPLEQLPVLDIGLVRGYVYQPLSPYLNDGRLRKVETSDNEMLLELLRLKRVDAVAMVDELFDHLLATGQVDARSFVRGAQLSDAPLVIKLQRRHASHLPALNAALRQLQDSGEVERIRKRYLSSELSATPQP